MTKQAYEQVLGRKLTDAEYGKLSGAASPGNGFLEKVGMQPAAPVKPMFAASPAPPQMDRVGSGLGAKPGEGRGPEQTINAKGADGKLYRFNSADEFFAAHKANPSLFNKVDPGRKLEGGGTAAQKMTAETGGAGTIAAASKADAPPPEKRDAPTAGPSLVGMDRPPAAPMPNAPIVTSAPAAKVPAVHPAYKSGMSIGNESASVFNDPAGATADSISDLWEAIVGDARKKHGL